jgi:hypothetical protein
MTRNGRMMIYCEVYIQKRPWTDGTANLSGSTESWLTSVSKTGFLVGIGTAPAREYRDLFLEQPAG